ncbi:TetR/AcrR family transcriptional regulator [Streptomyces yaanensis]|uniref:TetR/AcrR family transcriptional regulator n=1 Tax=Streptomyces yaanensis TaxID=1142239 RepID=A0ABV7SKY9_9ACTN|nr:TetR family transcriptional regulator [Streptomyces sp. CGMCC 4.7035]WNB97471.1 TetR family transcriptional regulator [Streptomyces sp. CGMCC 4.7035]
MAATANRSTPAAEPRLGLRERKKIKTRMAIRKATYRLIEEQGYDATTIEQIAEAAEVSPSTVFRYFPTKEDIVITDEYDPILEEELRARPVDEPLLESLRHVVHSALERSMSGEYETPEEMRLRARLMVEVPAVRSRMNESLSVTGQMMCRVVAERTGRTPGDLEVRVYCMSVVGALMEASRYWAEHGQQGDLGEYVARALNVLEHGLPQRKSGAS